MYKRLTCSAVLVLEENDSIFFSLLLPTTTWRPLRGRAIALRTPFPVGRHGDHAHHGSTCHLGLAGMARRKRPYCGTNREHRPQRGGVAPINKWKFGLLQQRTTSYRSLYIKGQTILGNAPYTANAQQQTAGRAGRVELQRA